MSVQSSPAAEAILGKGTVEKDDPCGCYVIRYEHGADVTFCEPHARARWIKGSK